MAKATDKPRKDSVFQILCTNTFWKKKYNTPLPPLFIVPADISSCDGRGIQEPCGFGCGVKWCGCTKKTFPRTLEDGWVDKDLPWAERSLVSCLTFLSQVQVTYSFATALKKLFWQVLSQASTMDGGVFLTQTLAAVTVGVVLFMPTRWKFNQYKSGAGY